MYILFFIFINIRFYLLAQILMLYFIRKIYVRGDIIDLGFASSERTGTCLTR